MATEKLIGADDTTSSESGGQNYVHYAQFTAVATGLMTEYKVKCSAAGNLKVAIYADAAGAPGALITAMNTGQAVSIGWTTLNFTSTTIINGVTYWLAFACDATANVEYADDAYARRYAAITYSTFTFSDPAASSTAGSNLLFMVAGWGTLGVAGRSYGFIIG